VFPPGLTGRVTATGVCERPVELFFFLQVQFIVLLIMDAKGVRNM